jgi:hypothetical protein
MCRQNHNGSVEFTFTNTSIEWRGPAPFFYVPVPDSVAQEIRSVAAMVTYGWGVIPVKVRIGQTEFTTSLFPKNGTYLVPVKVVVQKAEGLKYGGDVTLTMQLTLRR